MYESNLHPLLEMQMIYNYIVENCSNTEEQCQILLSMLPESLGGLSILCNGIFHENPSVRYKTVIICDRMQLYESTAPAYHALNGYYVSAISRQKAHIESGSLVEESEAYEHRLRETISSLRNGEGGGSSGSDITAGLNNNNHNSNNNDTSPSHYNLKQSNVNNHNGRSIDDMTAYNSI